MSLSAADRNHRMVIAKAARFDNHPHPVIPTPPRNTNNNSQVGRKLPHYPFAEEEETDEKSRPSACKAENGVGIHYGEVQRHFSGPDEVISPSLPNNTSKTDSAQHSGYITASSRNKMERGISKASENEYIIHQARNHVENQFQTQTSSCSSSASPTKEEISPVYGRIFSPTNPVVNRDFIDTPVYTFTLPDLAVYTDEFRKFLEKDLIEISSLVSLEQAGRLNWWAETGTCQKLWPLATTGDGNCLLHAASLGMWGFHDRLLTLRKALHTFLSCSASADSIYRRWRWQCHLQNLQYGLQLSEREWQDEWKSVLRLASSEPRSSSSSSDTSFMSSSSSSSSTASSSTAENTGSRRRSRLSMVIAEGGGCSNNRDSSHTTQQPLYESLEEIHVLALSHILRRPIIVVADTVLKDMNGEALAPIPFGGVYLPLEISPSDCHRSPLLLTFNAGHFSALVTMQSERPVDSHVWQPAAVIPVTDSNHQLLPLQFAVDPGPDFVWNKDEYPDGNLTRLAVPNNGHLNLLNSYLELVKVALPEWILETDFGTSQQPQSHKTKSMARSIGKKLKKNLGKLTRTGSFKSNRTQQSGYVDRPDQGRIVSTNQAFILSAFIHTHQNLPFQNEMVENYLEEARQRFEVDKELKKKIKEEQVEQEEKRKREIYLNGGYIDCITPNCSGQATASAYLCKNCQEEEKFQFSERNISPAQECGKSIFYTSNEDEVDNGIQNLSLSADVLHPEAGFMTVKLPPPSSGFDSSGGECQSPGCDFYGAPEFDGLCSKCYSNVQKSLS